MRALPLRGAAARTADLRAALRMRDFRVYQVGNTVSTVGFWMQRVAVGWVTWEMTGSEAWLGLVAFAELFPSILTGLWGGALADRTSGLAIMRMGQAGVLAVSTALWALQAAGWLTPGLILALMVVLGALSGLTLPARLAMASVLVPGPLLPSALAVNAMSFNLSRLVGPAVAGLLLAGMGAGVVFAAAALGYAVFVASLRAIEPPTPPAAAAPREGPSTWAVIAGLGAAPLVLAAIAVQALQGLTLRPAAEFFPAFSEEVFGRGAAGLGLLNAALGLGAILGALLLSRTRGPGASVRHVLWGTVAFALTLAAFAALDLFWPALVVLVVQGAAMASSNIAAMAHVQTATPRERLGRVLSLYALAFRAGPAMGALAFGLGAEALGLRAAALLAAALGIAGTAAVAAFMRRSERGTLADA